MPSRVCEKIEGFVGVEIVSRVDCFVLNFIVVFAVLGGMKALRRYMHAISLISKHRRFSVRSAGVHVLRLFEFFILYRPTLQVRYRIDISLKQWGPGINAKSKMFSFSISNIFLPCTAL